VGIEGWIWKLKKLVNLKVTGIETPQFDIMKIGVKQHIDRDYTYDEIPDEMINGYLFQNVHRTPNKTKFKFEVLKPLTAYFIYHDVYNGGYDKSFSKFAKKNGWVLCDDAPKYDINNPNPGMKEHGLHMTMYKLEANRGYYKLPKTKSGKQWSCISMVFKER